MANKKISQLPFVGFSDYTPNDIIAIVNYQNPIGVTNSTPLKDVQTYILSGLTDVFATGGTYSAGTITIENTTGGTFTITGLPITKAVFYKSAGLNLEFKGFFYEPFCDGGTDPVAISGSIPNDFGSIISSDIITIPEFSGNVVTDIDLVYGQNGDLFGGNLISTAITYSYTIDTFTQLDVLPVFSAVTTNDNFSITTFQNDTKLFILGLKLRYTTL
jgi:hypothetical protein